jgi:hypothetical protein
MLGSTSNPHLKMMTLDPGVLTDPLSQVKRVSRPAKVTTSQVNLFDSKYFNGVTDSKKNQNIFLS